MLDHTLALQQPQDATDRDLQDFGDVAVGQAGQRVEAELAELAELTELTELVLDIDAVQRERVEVGVESQVGRNALHDGDGTALGASETTCFEVSPVPGEHRVHERMTRYRAACRRRRAEP